MQNEFAYMLCVAGVSLAVTFFMRAVPFILFSRRRGPLPPAVEKAGNLVSPVIIACLVVYSYSGLAWKTPWPYAAALATVALQWLFGNPLASILSGTVLYMALLALCGCVSTAAVDTGASAPSIVVKQTGITLNGTYTDVPGVVEALEEAGVPKSDTVHILLDSGVRDMREARFLMGMLARAGWRRSVLVTKRHGESSVRGRGAGGLPRPQH